MKKVYKLYCFSFNGQRSYTQTNAFVYTNESLILAQIVKFKKNSTANGLKLYFLYDYAILGIIMLYYITDALMAACSWSPLHLSWYPFTRQD